MEDYWRFQDRELGLAKRLRPDYDDLIPLRGGLYPREESLPGERYAWTKPQVLGLGGGLDSIRNGLPYTSASDLSGLGTTGFVGAGTVGLGTGAGLGLGLGLGVDPLSKPSGVLNSGQHDYLAAKDSKMERPVPVPPSQATSTLFVEGFPSDVSRREVAHIFRPFLGFKEVRLVRKDSKRPGVEQFIMCFVDFVDAKCASVALEALQGYKFDEFDPHSETLKLEFARTPIRPGPRRFGHP